MLVVSDTDLRVGTDVVDTSLRYLVGSARPESIETTPGKFGLLPAVDKLSPLYLSFQPSE